MAALRHFLAASTSRRYLHRGFEKEPAAPLRSTIVLVYASSLLRAERMLCGKARLIIVIATDAKALCNMLELLIRTFNIPGAAWHVCGCTSKTLIWQSGLKLMRNFV